MDISVVLLGGCVACPNKRHTLFISALRSQRDEEIDLHKAVKEQSISPKIMPRNNWMLRLPIVVAILAAFLYLVYPSLSATYNYLYGPFSPVVSYNHDTNNEPVYYDDESDYDGIHGVVPMYNTLDIWGSPILALRDQYHRKGNVYVPIYTYEDYELQPPKPIKRYDLEYDKVACWQDDGVWIKRLSPVEMAFLGVDRFEDTERAASQTDESEFCARLGLHGASFWTLPIKWPELHIWCSTIECVEPVKKVSFEAGFPTGGGVWLLNTTSDNVDVEIIRFENNVALKNALTMDERCNVIKSLGGIFCQDIRACTTLDNLLLN